VRVGIEPSHNGFRKFAVTDWLKCLAKTLLQSRPNCRKSKQIGDLREKLAPESPTIVDHLTRLAISRIERSIQIHLRTSFWPSPRPDQNPAERRSLETRPRGRSLAGRVAMAFAVLFLVTEGDAAAAPLFD
jgi:hypothetical protein